MLPESMRENLWRKVSQSFGTDDEGVKKVALKLQDEGYGDEEIMQMIRLVWRAAYYAGYDSGHADGSMTATTSATMERK